jgi:hypothetical protein
VFILRCRVRNQGISIMARILSIADDIDAHPSSKTILKRRAPLSMPVRRMNRPATASVRQQA